MPAGSEEATALNSPGTKWTLGSSLKNVGPWTGGLTFRNVNAYFFRSGTNIGVIPTFGTLDASVSSRIPHAAEHDDQRERQQSLLVHARRREVQDGHAPANSMIDSRKARLWIQQDAS